MEPLCGGSFSIDDDPCLQPFPAEVAGMTAVAPPWNLHRVDQPYAAVMACQNAFVQERRKVMLRDTSDSLEIVLYLFLSSHLCNNVAITI
jgi:hypothetical protein